MKDIHNNIASNKWTGILILIFIVLMTYPWLNAYAAEYYMDSLDGNDLNSGTSPVMPWKTLDKSNSVKYYPGDIIYFKCGRIWRGQLNISSSGTSGNPITFKSYGLNCGPGTKPIITASRKVNGWRHYSDNIYVADVQIGIVKQMRLNGQKMNLARYPDTGYLSITRDSLPGSDIEEGAQFLYYSSLPDKLDPKSLPGARIRIRTTDWLIEDREITSFEPSLNKLNWQDETVYALRKGHGYYLENKLWMLDHQEEWYFDTNNKKLYAWLLNNMNPDETGVSIEISDRDYAVSITSAENVHIDGIDVRNSGVDGISIINSRGIVISNCIVSVSGRNGINIINSPDSSVNNSEVRGSVQDGINIRFSDGTVIYGNIIENTGTVGSPVRSNGAIYIRNSVNSVIQNNKIVNSGYAGIYFTGGAAVLNNIIENSCMVLNDCGAIYTWNDFDLRAAYDSKIVGNIIDNVIGNAQGTPRAKSLARGIYLDEYSNGIHVFKNTVVNSAEYGICLHNAFNNIIEENTIYGKGDAQLAILESAGMGLQRVVTGNIFSKNIMFPLSTNEPILLRGEFSNIDFGFFNNNIFPLLYSRQVVLEMYRQNYPAVDSFSANSYRLDAWQQKRTTNTTNNILINLFDVMSYKIISLDSDNLIGNGSFDNNLVSWEVWSDNKDAEVNLISNCNVSGGCVKFTSGLKSVSNIFASKGFNIRYGKVYRLSFRARAFESDQSTQLIIRRGEPPYESIGLEKTVSVSNKGWINYNYIFVANKTLNNAQLHFHLPMGQAAILIDDITISEVTVEYNDTSDDAYILINRTATPQDIYCPVADIDGICDQYIDLDKRSIVWPVKLQGYSSMIIVWNNNPYQDRIRPLPPNKLNIY